MYNPAGVISDKIGRKKILVAGYFFYGLVYFGFAYASVKISIWIMGGITGILSAVLLLFLI